MQRGDLKSISFDPGLEDASDEDIKLLHNFLLANPNIQVMKVLDIQTFAVDGLIYANHTKDIKTILA